MGLFLNIRLFFAWCDTFLSCIIEPQQASWYWRTGNVVMWCHGKQLQRSHSCTRKTNKSKLEQSRGLFVFIVHEHTRALNLHPGQRARFCYRYSTGSCMHSDALKKSRNSEICCYFCGFISFYNFLRYWWTYSEQFGAASSTGESRETRFLPFVYLLWVTAS